MKYLTTTQNWLKAHRPKAVVYEIAAGVLIALFAALASINLTKTVPTNHKRGAGAVKGASTTEDNLANSNLFAFTHGSRGLFVIVGNGTGGVTQGGGSNGGGSNGGGNGGGLQGGPIVSVPGITIPGVTIPGLGIPAINVPSISVPSITVPTITVPGGTTITLPGITVPQVTTPLVNTPVITTPVVNVTLGL